VFIRAVSIVAVLVVLPGCLGLLPGISSGRIVPDIHEGTPPPGPVSLIAEWEPALGALVHWPLHVPEDLVREIAEDDILFVVTAPDDVAEVRRSLEALGIRPESMRVIASGAESWYPRDYGPHQIFDGEGRFGILDQVFAGWPLFEQEGEPWKIDEPDVTFRARGDDDGVEWDIAAALGVPVWRMPAFLTGGNFLVDGRGTAFCSDAQVDENLAIHDEESFRDVLRTYVGVERLVVMPNTERWGIQHIDCWLKVLDPERLLVKRVTADHPEHERLERNVEALSALTTSSGGRFEIVRIDCPPIDRKAMDDEDSPTAAYTNSLILNRKVLVPLYGVEGDAAALETWRGAMPGYEVIGFEYDDWQTFDALHCRTRAVFDPTARRPVPAR